MDGSWSGQTTGMGTTGWMPLYMMAQGYGMPPGQPMPQGGPPPGQGQMPQQDQGTFPMQGQPPPQGQPMGQAPQFPQGFQPQQQGGPSPLGTSTQGVPTPQMPQGTGQGFNQGFGKPPSLSNFLPQQGRQIMGNPTTTYVGQGGIASAIKPGQYD